MKWGLICPVCDRLLWKGEKKLERLDRPLSKDWVHAVEERPATLHEPIYWCGCKPMGRRLKQQDLVSST